jgi:hypothetical protein
MNWLNKKTIFLKLFKRVVKGGFSYSPDIKLIRFVRYNNSRNKVQENWKLNYFPLDHNRGKQSDCWLS